MSNKRRLITGLVSLLSVSGFISSCLLFPSFNLSNKDINKASASVDVLPAFEESSDTPNPDAVPLNVEDLSVSITKSSITPSTQSYSVTFSSQIQTYTNRNRHCFLNISDPSFHPDEQTEYEKEEDMPHYAGNVYIIQNVRSGASVYVPKYMKRGTQFFIDTVSINGNVIEDDSKSKIANIYIPREIDSIGEDAFVGLNSNVTIYCEIDSKPESWSDSWTDCQNIVWGYEYTQDDIKESTYNAYGGGETFGTGNNYFIGFENTNLYLPLQMYFEAYDSVAQTTTSYFVDLPINDSRVSIPAGDDRLFEGVGSLIGSSSYTKNIDLEIPETIEVLDDTIKFYNIYIAEKNPINNLYEPVLDVEYCVSTRLGYAVKENINDYIEFTFVSNSSYSGYTSLSLNVDKSSVNIYESIKASTYESNLKNILNGSMYIRYRFTALNSAKYLIIYEYQGQLIESYVPIYSPIPQYIIESSKNNNVSFLIENSTVGEGFIGSNIKSFSIIGLTISLDLFTSTGSIVSKSATSTRFGILNIVNDLGQDSIPIPYYDGNLVLILTCVIFSLIYFVLSIALFLYLKRKYRNDEFRRVKPKNYIKSAVILFAGCMSCILSIIFIYFRSVPFNNAVVVYNPLDVYVIVFTIAAVFFVGYYIRNLVVAIKANRERKRIIKLKLDEASDDDGTK